MEKRFGKDIYSIWDSKSDEKKHAANALRSLENTEVLKEAKIYGFGKYLVAKYDEAFRSFLEGIINKLNMKFALNEGINIIRGGIFGATQFYLISQVISRSISISGYTFYLENITNFVSILQKVQINLAKLYEYSLSAKDFRYFLDLPTIIKHQQNAEILTYGTPKIEFRNVFFRYTGMNNYVLDNISFTINPGEKIALISENGGGKSTLIKLLARFYDVTDGSILINGIDIKQIDLDSYYDLWGVLFQQFAKYWFSPQENIALGKLEYSNDNAKVKNAATIAGANKFIENLPHKYKNMLSTEFKDGVELSGGQWQKIGIARGVFSDPKLIVLDEPTSALDSLAETHFFNRLEKISKNATMIMVSHRFATVRNADRILVIEQGKISEDGNHEELMKIKGLNSKMFKAQAAGYK